MASISDLIPPSEGGYLPYFLLFQGVAAWIHTVACYASSPSGSLVQFSGPKAPPPHALTAHCYGIKNLYSGAIRLYAAYNITNAATYDLAILSFAGVLLLYIPETFVYRHSRMREMWIPFILAGGGVLWLWTQRGYYLSV